MSKRPNYNLIIKILKEFKNNLFKSGNLLFNEEKEYGGKTIKFKFSWEKTNYK